MLVSTPTDTLTLQASSAGTLHVVVSFVDHDPAYSDPKLEFVEGRQRKIITDILENAICDPPGAGKKRNIKAIQVSNVELTASNTITIRQNDSGASPAALVVGPPKVQLLAGEWGTMNDNAVWFFYDAVLGGAKSSAGATVDPFLNDFRLSGVSATPVMISDNAALTTIYLAQHVGNRIALYDGQNWQLFSPAVEVSYVLAARTADLPFDIFAYSPSAGTVALEPVNFASANARATALVRLDGVVVKSGDPTRRYLGTCRPRSATTYSWVLNPTETSSVRFDLWNYANRVDFSFVQRDTVNTHLYATATWRQWNAAVAHQVDIVVGLQEEGFVIDAYATSTTATTTISRSTGIGYDSTTAPSGLIASSSNPAAVASQEMSHARFANQPIIGRHFYAWLELGGTGVTFLGDNGATQVQSGISGLWTC